VLTAVLNLQKNIIMKTKTFETYRDMSSSYWENQVKSNEPNNINFLSYRKYKVTIELVKESKDVLIERLEVLLKDSKGYNNTERLKKEIAKFKTLS
jgi:hypothetical protein